MVLHLRRFLPFLTVAALIPIIVLCSRDLGNNPIGPNATGNDSTNITVTPGTTPDSVNRFMSISVKPQRILASLDDTALVTVYVSDEWHNPLANQPVYFTLPKQGTHGIITAMSTTNAQGKATAVYRAIQHNIDDTIYAMISLNDTATYVAQFISVYDLKIRVTPQASNVLIGTTVPVGVSVLDGQGEPVAGAIVSLSGTTATTGTTNGSGVFNTTVTSSTERTITLSASTRGAIDTASVTFWSKLPSGTDTATGIRALRIFSSRSQLKADNSDSATITAILTNENNNPATGETIIFRTDLGIIDSTAVVNSEGRATVTLKSSPVNGVCNVTAVLKNRPEVTDVTSVIIAGVALRISTLTPELSVRDTALVDVQLTDGSGNAIGGDTVNFAITSASGTFANGLTSFQAVLDPNGKTSARVRTSVATGVTVRASALNTEDTITLSFSASNLDITASKSSLLTGGKDSTLIVATYINNAGQGIPNAWILFATNAGIISRDSVQTDANGNATTYLRSANFSTTATVQAKSAGGSAVTYVEYIAAPPKYITLKITPDNIGVNGGVATLIATVTDTNQNMVSGVNVNFRILKGPGGGEYIVNPIAITTNGVATSQLKAGSIPSLYRAVEVVATVAGVADSTKLTISGEPYIISVSRPEDDTITVPDGGIMGPSVFQCNVGAVVQDVNGNPVADGTPVHFSAVISGMSVATRTFIRWETTNGDVKPIIGYSYYDVPFEDINNNYTMDPNVDLTINENNSTASRGDDNNGDGSADYDPAQHDFFWFFTGPEPYWPGSKDYINITDPGDPRYQAPVTKIDTSVRMIVKPTISADGKTLTFDTTYQFEYDTTLLYALDSTYAIFADLNRNGRWDDTPAEIDHNSNGFYNGPASGDFSWWKWEMRPFLMGRFDFATNDFAVTVPSSIVTTKNGVAEGTITYPRQFARRLIVSVNAESHGIRDRDGERFVLPIIK